MGDSHDGKAYRFHDQDGILPMDQNDFFGQPALPVASYHFWGAPGYHPQNSSNNSNVANGQVQDGDYMQRGFYGSASSHLPGLMSTTTGPRPSINDMTLGLSSAQHLNHQFSLHAPDMSLGFNGQAATQSPGQCCHITQQYELQQYSHPPFQQIPIKTQQQDDDCISVGSSTTDCDSNCGLADPCTDESCAGRDDACTDRHCPEKDCPDTNCPEKMPSEVVVAAATLTAFGVEPPQQQRHDTSYQGEPRLRCNTVYPWLTQNIGIGGHELLPPSQQPHFDGMLDMATFTPLDLVKHIGVAHNDGASSNCMGPCPIENPQVFQHFQHCPFPVTFDFQLDSFSDILNPFSLNSFNNDGSVNFPSQSQAQFHGCGAEFSNPEALVEHFNTQHRHALENVLAQSNACSGSAAPQLSARTFSSPSSKAVGPSPPSATHSPHVSFPPTPLSLSQDISNTSKPSSHHSRSSTVSQTGPGNENEPQPCLWCSPETGERCGQVFRDSEALFAHVNSEHIQKLEKGHRGFLCNWENCKRRGDGKEGFPQRSKIERHMHTHIGRKYPQ